MKTLKKKKKKRKREENPAVSISKTSKPNGKARNERKKEKRKEKKGRGETKKVRDPSCYPRRDAAHARKTHLAAVAGCSISTAQPSVVAPLLQPSQFTGIYSVFVTLSLVLLYRKERWSVCSGT